MNELMSVTRSNFFNFESAQTRHKDAASWRPTDNPRKQVFLLKSLDDTMVEFAHASSPRKHKGGPTEGLPGLFEP